MRALVRELRRVARALAVLFGADVLARAANRAAALVSLSLHGRNIARRGRGGQSA